MEGLMKKGSLGSILFTSQIITENDIAAALERQKVSGCRFGEALVDLGIVTQEDIDWALSNQLDIPYVRLKRDMIDADSVVLVPAQLARQFNLIPLIRSGDELRIAMADPLNTQAITEVERASGCRATVAVALIREIREMQTLFYGPEGGKSFGFTSEHFPVRILTTMNADTSGAMFLNYLLLYLLQKKLASVSLQPVDDMVRVTGKRGGACREIGWLPTTYYPDFIKHLRKLARLNGSGEVFAHGELSFSQKGHAVKFEAHFLRGMSSEYVTLKPHNASSFPLSAAKLTMNESVTARFRLLTAVTDGIVCISSPGVEEVSRLIDLFLEECDTTGKTVMLLGGSLGQGKKRFPRLPLHSPESGALHVTVDATLEHDPDIIAIEESTGFAALNAAAKAALRGKLVVTGISGSNREGTLAYLLHSAEGSHPMSRLVRGVIRCTAVMTLCPHCKKRVILPTEEIAALQLPASANGYCRAGGCEACGHSGYGEKRFLVEVIPFAAGRPTVSTTTSEVGESAVEERDRGITAEGTDLLLAGAISPEEFVASILM